MLAGGVLGSLDEQADGEQLQLLLATYTHQREGTRAWPTCLATFCKTPCLLKYGPSSIGVFRVSTASQCLGYACLVCSSGLVTVERLFGRLASAQPPPERHLASLIADPLLCLGCAQLAVSLVGGTWGGWHLLSHLMPDVTAALMEGHLHARKLVQHHAKVLRPVLLPALHLLRSANTHVRAQMHAHCLTSTLIGGTGAAFDLNMSRTTLVGLQALDTM